METSWASAKYMEEKYLQWEIVLTRWEYQLAEVKHEHCIFSGASLNLWIKESFSAAKWIRKYVFNGEILNHLSYLQIRPLRQVYAICICLSRSQPLRQFYKDLVSAFIHWCKCTPSVLRNFFCHQNLAMFIKQFSFASKWFFQPTIRVNHLFKHRSWMNRFEKECRQPI